MRNLILIIILFLSSVLYADPSYYYYNMFNSSTTKQTMRIGGDLYLGATANQGDYYTVLTSTGYIGVGTTNPSERAEFAGAIKVTGAVGLAGNYTSSGMYDFSSGNARLLSFGANGTTMGGFQFYQASNDNSPAQFPLVIDAIGNIGIGNTTPTCKLDVDDYKFRIRQSSAVMNSKSDGEIGEIRWGQQFIGGTDYYIYVCTGTSGWARVKLDGNFIDQGLACPYVYSDGKLQGTVMFKQERNFSDGMLWIKDVPLKSLLIREEEPEISYIKKIELQIYSYTESTRTIKVRTIYSNLRDMIFLRRGDSCYIDYDFTGLKLKNNERLYLKVTGFYERVD